ncbi:MAG: ribosome biogenesis GTPase Der, partial [Chloroflexi bacterium]|nr:ribosome biogenesis GTPase Der [Chloroflexota bacterium]
MSKPIVALVGRPNVGKSTLFNRLVGERRAIVEDLPGTTRDRLYGDLDWNGVEFTVVDTGGLVLTEKPDDLLAQMIAQAQLALDEADVIIMLVDAIEGLHSGDQDVAHMLRRTDKPVILVANKADNVTLRLEATEFYSLGLGDPYPVSSIHGTGSGDLLDKVVEAFPALDIEDEAEALHIAILGRPNVGKSSLLNAMIGQERAIVSAIPGTTRDPVDTRLVWDDQPVVIIDTAGIRRRGKIEPGIEKYAVLRTLRAVSRCDVALLLLDASEGLMAQDTHIAGYILEEKKGIIIVVNKWDAVEKDTYTT